MIEFAIRKIVVFIQVLVGDAQQWVGLLPFITDAGRGVARLETILAHAKKSGVNISLLEMM